MSLIKGGGEQHCNEYREVNPMEQVPSLCIGKREADMLSLMSKWTDHSCGLPAGRF